ncbi:MAG: ABC transporter ATP-binding protein [Oscillospiraceae bacterium]|jgi:ABC-type multidrug transport system, ATPase and permease components|nr:ABC transporter ATP-binding protein [Oscillospiraceae bacterium]MBQ5412693.1 ABC transporter ATP-binding protein [Oscillospiraceae bacterium]
MAKKNSYQLGQANINSGARGPMRIAEKPKDLKGAAKKLLAYGRDILPQFILAVAASVFSVIMTLFGPDHLSRMTNLIEAGLKSGGVDIPAVIRVAIRSLVFYLIASLLILIQSLNLNRASQKLMRTMRSDITHKLNRIPLKSFDSSSFGDVLSRITNDVDTIGMSLNMASSSVVTSIVTFIGCTIMMLLKNVKLTVIVLLCSILGFMLVNVIIKRSQGYFTRRQSYLGMMNGHIEEMYAGHLIVKAYNGEKESRETFEYLNDKLFENNWKSQFISGITFPLMELLSNLGYVAVCVFGAMMAKNGTIPFGTIIAFVIYVRMFTMPMSMVANAITNLQSAAAACERVFEFLDVEEMEDESGKTARLENVKGDVEFSHVRFGYDPDKTIINDFSASIEAGKKVAIVGPTGAGKTTMVNLLMRFYEINDGKISIDGIDTRDVTRENVHDQFCMVLQDSWLFEGTIRENIVFSMKDVSDEKVIEACKLVGLHNYISGLPNGYDTVLSEDSNMSAGQRQLMTIARAMIQNAPLLILDEATSSVDTRTEQIVQDAMDLLTRGRTSFTIAHRLSTIRNADIILVMRDGDIVETGTHEELLEKGGFYSELWTSQFVNAEAI